MMSNYKKFLALVAMVACMISVLSTQANAAGIRARVRGGETSNNQRKLAKSAKSKGAFSKNHGSSSSSSSSSSSTSSTGTTATSNNMVVNNNVNSVGTGISVANFEAKCPNEDRALTNCMMGSTQDQRDCKLCIIGQASFTQATANGLATCTKEQFGRICGNCPEQVKDFYECGTGKTVVGTTTTTTTSTTVTFDPNTVVITGGHHGHQTTSMGDWASPTACPTTAVAAGDTCSVPAGFKYLKCANRGLVCTCRSDSPQWACYEGETGSRIGGHSGSK